MNRANQLVRVVINCASRKTKAPLSDLRLRGYPKTLEIRATRWIDRIKSPESDRIEANDLYQGEHWSVVRKIVETADEVGCRADVWVVSAGYGLVPVKALVEPYSATFSLGSADSVAQGKSGKSPQEANRDWWGFLRNWSGPCSQAPRSLTDLARLETSAPMLVALSNTYVQAVRDDLVGAAEAMGDKADLLLVSTGRPPEGLEETQLPCDARLVNTLGGTRTSLNARVADHIVRRSPDHGFDAAGVKKMLQGKIRRSGPIPRYDHRDRMSDEEVRAQIRARRRNGDREPSRTALLRELRDDGFACEQKRFAGLYEEVVSDPR